MEGVRRVVKDAADGGLDGGRACRAVGMAEAGSLKQPGHFRRAKRRRSYRLTITLAPESSWGADNGLRPVGSPASGTAGPGPHH